MMMIVWELLRRNNFHWNLKLRKNAALTKLKPLAKGLSIAVIHATVDDEIAVKTSDLKLESV